MTRRLRAAVAALALAVAVPPAEASFVMAESPGGRAAIEYDDFLWRPQIGGDVLFFACRHADCGGSGSWCTLSTVLTGSTDPLALREDHVRTMTREVTLFWSAQGMADMAEIERPRAMMHGENMGAYGTYRAIQEGNPVVLTFYFIPSNGFTAAATCFTPEAMLSAGVWEIQKLIAGIRLKGGPP